MAAAASQITARHRGVTGCPSGNSWSTRRMPITVRIGVGSANVRIRRGAGSAPGEVRMA